jgi:hypothetical protein
MPDPINISFRGLNELNAKLNKLGKSLEKYLSSGAQQAGKEIVKTEGLQKYPPTTESNQPGRYSLVNKKPMGYYTRGKGWNYPLVKNGNVVGYKNTKSSENYGKQFHVDKVPYGARIGNRASYAPYLTDEKDQSKYMASRGWRKLKDVANEKIEQIKQTLQTWIDKALKDSQFK